jgi:hypothetical protein
MLMQITLRLTDEETKALFKQAILELIEAQDNALYEWLMEALEDMALGRAIEEGETSGVATREEIFAILEG